MVDQSQNSETADQSEQTGLFFGGGLTAKMERFRQSLKKRQTTHILNITTSKPVLVEPQIQIKNL